jgi:hypothetical protein
MSRYVGSLFFLFWVVANVLELTLSYFMWLYTGAQMTGAWSGSVESAWYAMALNQMIISSLVGLGLFYFARYGVLLGLTIAMYALCVYQGYQVLELIG